VLQRGKLGAAYLATRADVPLVPVAISGTEHMAQRIWRLRRTPVRVAIGEPFRLPEHGRVPTQNLIKYTESIMLRIAELLPPEYRGAYAVDSSRTSPTSACMALPQI
jgi:1-acyl-sn-glycerol-3-phosphate acyltransferase